MSNKIHTDKAPAAIGPYSQAVTVGSLVFTSGQIALDPETGLPRREHRPAALLRRYASSPIWLTLQPLTRSTDSISPKSPRVPA